MVILVLFLCTDSIVDFIKSCCCYFRVPSSFFFLLEFHHQLFVLFQLSDMDLNTLTLFSCFSSQSGAISLDHPDERVLGLYLIRFAEVSLALLTESLFLKIFFQTYIFIRPRN